MSIKNTYHVFCVAVNFGGASNEHTVILSRKTASTPGVIFRKGATAWAKIIA